MANKMDLMLHPVRVRILQQVMRERRVTAQQLAEKLSDVPPATLYRHLNKLVEGDLLTVLQERQVRGAVEKVYGLQLDGVITKAPDVSTWTPEDHMKSFTVYISHLMASFQHYLTGDVDMVRDGVTYRFVDLYLSDEEFVQMVTEWRELFKKYLDNEASPGRRIRTVATMVIPERTPKQED